MGTDKLFYEYATHFPNPLAQFLGVESDDYEAKSITFKEMERRSDTFLIGRSGTHVVLVETQGYDDEWLYYGMVKKLVLFCTQFKYRGRIDAAVVFLDESHWRVAQAFGRQFDETSVLRFSPKVYVFRRIKVEQLLEHGNIYLTPLYPLCDLSPAEIERRAPEWAEEIRRSPELNVEERINLLAFLAGAISHRVRNLTADQIHSLLGGFTMEDTPIVQEILKEKSKIWIEQGIEQGAQRIILKQIATRFGSVPNDVLEKIQHKKNAEDLERIATELFRIQSLQELRDLTN